MSNKKKRDKGKAIIKIILITWIFLSLDYFTNTLTSLIATLGIISFIYSLVILKRGYFWTDKEGNKLSFKEFMRNWRKGIQGITPLQQSKMNLMGIWITITGVISGIVVNALVRIENMWWWIEIILVGSFILTAVQFLGIYQKYLKHKEVDKLMRELNKK